MSNNINWYVSIGGTGTAQRIVNQASGGNTGWTTSSAYLHTCGNTNASNTIQFYVNAGNNRRVTVYLDNFVVYRLT